MLQDKMRVSQYMVNEAGEDQPGTFKSKLA